MVWGVVLKGIFVGVYIFLFSHLTIDKDIPSTMKVGSWIVFIALAILYFVFLVIF